ncbi:uncharacterized protein BDCG_04072 [Blastomyces dermatitidis ER-3]|uniref:Uncharacterized protein n=2 Tax=Ajellomyces dermatitidis TaxID=5039 RepID=F2TGI7_AJEDA|nr:uncharacterized protein BDCG_04072 [Blastomyces dermatitidis ER-3]EEQ88952.2 hypothetical protein BDCG_04072 [Blastomyces dermatitidis ER-3]EGE82328.2 hypothetical protein BDDG_05272 [Blastomyces dermatitidis ATCC 18188]
MTGVFNRLLLLQSTPDDNVDKSLKRSHSTLSRISSSKIRKFRYRFRDSMSFSQTFTEQPQEAGIQKHYDIVTLLGNADQYPVEDVPSPPPPVQNYTVENLKDRLMYVDGVLRNSQRKPSPIGTRALHIYKDTCARLLDLEQEDGELTGVKDIWRATLRKYDRSLQNTPCLQVACSSDDQILQDRLITLQKATFYARYADLFAELSIRPEPGIGTAEQPYWAEIWRKLQLEDDASYRCVFNGVQCHQENPTHLAIYRAWDRIGLSRSNVIQTIHEFATCKDLKHMNILPMVKTGKFDDIKKHLYHDSSIIPLLIHGDDWKLLRFLSLVIQSLTDLWFDRRKIDPENYQMWTYTKALRSLYRQLQGEDYSVPQGQLACDIARKIRKRLRDMEDEEKAMETLSMTIGPVRPSGNKKTKRAAVFSASQVRAERERAMKMAADWNYIINRVHVAEDTSHASCGKYSEPADPL